MKINRIIHTSLVLFFIAGLSLACNKDGGEEGEGGSSPQERITTTYASAMSDLQSLVEGQPDIETLRPQVEELKEETIQQLVAIGRELEELPESEVNQIGRGVLREAQGQIGDITWLQEANTHYRELDNDLANMIASFNTITQYAFFDLLCSQKPEEAARLEVTCE